VKTGSDTLAFHPYFTVKDGFVLGLFVILFAVFVFYMPDSLGHPDNYIQANPLQTPPEIVPEWYYLPFYAMLRSVPNKLAGVLVMFGSIFTLFILPWLDTSKVRSMRYRPIARQFFFFFVIVCIALGWCGGQNPGRILAKNAPYRATLSWVQGGSVVERDFSAPSEDAFPETAAAMDETLTGEGATMTMVTRQNATDAHAMAVMGGAHQSRSVTGDTLDEMDARVEAIKAEVGSAAPFFTVERQLPFAFTVTRLSQILTAYYFLFFLLILPALGLRETPGRVPDTIAKPVTAKGGA
jgi:Cytochrome b(C-terminal)/b6/petD